MGYAAPDIDFQRTPPLRKANILIVLLSCAPLAAPAAAQIAQPIPRQRGVLAEPMKPHHRQEALQACPEYGPGFVRQPGSRTCVRISGQVRGEVGVRQRGSNLQDGPGFNARGRIMLDTRTETELGPLRLVFRGDGKSGSNWMAR